MHVRSTFHATNLPVAILVAVTLPIAGCGQGDYDSRVATISQVIEIRKSQRAKDLVSPGIFSLLDSASKPQGIRFQLPVDFVGSTVKSLGADVPRAKIPQLDLPGFCYTLEATPADSPEKPVPAYCYLHAVSKAANPTDQLKQTIKQQVAAIDPAADWKPVKANLPTSMIAMKGTFEFEVNGMTENLPGVMAIYVVEGTENIGIIGWRFHDTPINNLKLGNGIKFGMEVASPDVPVAPMPAPAVP